MKLIIGLGNPGAEYEETRHNAGFRAIDLLCTAFGAELKLSKNLSSLISKSKLKGEEIVLAKPLTYMNESGRATAAIVRWFKIPQSDVLVLHDDVSIPLGRLRMQRGGGAGGQHGVESIIDCLGGARDFHRIKIGVGPDPGGDVRARFVLSRVSEEQRPLYEESLAMVAAAAESWLWHGAQETANKFNGRNLQEQPKPVKKPADKPEAPDLASNSSTRHKQMPKTDFED